MLVQFPQCVQGLSLLKVLGILCSKKYFGLTPPEQEPAFPTKSKANSLAEYNCLHDNVKFVPTKKP